MKQSKQSKLLQLRKDESKIGLALTQLRQKEKEGRGQNHA